MRFTLFILFYFGNTLIYTFVNKFIIFIGKEKQKRKKQKKETIKTLSF